MFGAEIAIKHEENAEFENAQIEVPVRGGGKGGGCAPLTPRNRRCFTRTAAQGRGGSRGLRPFRRGLWDGRKS